MKIAGKWIRLIILLWLIFRKLVISILLWKCKSALELMMSILPLGLIMLSWKLLEINPWLSTSKLFWRKYPKSVTLLGLFRKLSRSIAVSLQNKSVWLNLRSSFNLNKWRKKFQFISRLKVSVSPLFRVRKDRLLMKTIYSEEKRRLLWKKDSRLIQISCFVKLLWKWTLIQILLILRKQHL